MPHFLTSFLMWIHKPSPTCCPLKELHISKLVFCIKALFIFPVFVSWRACVCPSQLCHSCHICYSSHVVWWLDAELLFLLLCVFRLDVLHVHFRQGPPSACNVGPEVPLVLVTQGPLFFLLLLPRSSLICESPFPVGDVKFESNIASENWCIALTNAAVQESGKHNIHSHWLSSAHGNHWYLPCQNLVYWFVGFWVVQWFCFFFF